MRRWALLIAIALVPLLMAGQVAVTPSGWATTAGPAVPVAQPGAPVGMTPEITFRTASPSPVGATNTTANNIAGASNATVVPPVVSAAPTQVEYVSPYPTVVGAGSSYALGTPATVPGGGAARLQVFDRGAGQFNSAYDIGTLPPDVSLGEVAREWRQKKATQNARTYTNEDIIRIQQQLGPPGGGLSGTAVSAGTSATSPTTTAQPASNIGAPSTQPAQPTPPPQPSAPPPEQAAAQSSSGQAQQAANPQEQTAVPNQAGHAELPETASPLPALLLLGIAAGTVGLAVRRKQRSR